MSLQKSTLNQSRVRFFSITYPNIFNCNIRKKRFVSLMFNLQTMRMKKGVMWPVHVPCIALVIKFFLLTIVLPHKKKNHIACKLLSFSQILHETAYEENICISNG